MSQPERPTCGTCPYWWEQTEVSGSCCIDRPTIIPEIARYQDALARQCDESVDLDHGQFPQTPPQAFCGRHPDFPAYIRALKEIPG